MKNKVKTFFLIQFFFIWQWAWAGFNTWTPLDGPEGCIVGAGTVDRVNPKIMYIACDSRFSSKVFKSFNGGRHWSALTVLAGSPHDLLMNQNGTLFLASEKGIYESSDQGNSWINMGLTDADVRSIAIDPVNNEIMYVGTGIGLFKSDNAGINWNIVESDQLVPSLNSVVIDPFDPRTIYVAGQNTYPMSSVSKSTDGGTYWHLTSIGTVAMNQLIINPTNPQNLLAHGFTSEIYKTTDAGDSWSTIEMDANVGAIAFHPLDGSTVYASIFNNSSIKLLKSMDQGLTWRRIPVERSLQSFIKFFLFDPSSPSTMFAATDSGIFRSKDAGRNWKLTNSGLNAAQTVHLAISKPQTLYAGTRFNGLNKLRSNRRNWKSVDGLPGNQILSLETDPRDNGVLYTSVSHLNSAKGIFKSEDSAASWNIVNDGLDDLEIRDIKIAPTKSQIVYAAGVFKIFKSGNSGKSWKELPWNCDGGGIILELDPTNTNRIFAGYSEPGTWTEAAFSRSTDGGETWECGLKPWTVPLTMGLDPSNPQTIYVGGYDGGSPFGGVAGLLKSSDFGSTWSLITGGLPERETVLSLAIDPVRPSILYVSIRAGVYKTEDSGNTWTSFNAGLENIIVNELLVDPTNSHIVYAATSFGVYSIEQP